jgi:hypothetical protein
MSESPILESLWSALKGGRWGCCLGCALLVAAALLLDRCGWIVLSLPVILGLSGFVIGFATSGKTRIQLRARALRQLHHECARSPYGLQVAESAVFQVAREVTMGERAEEAFRTTFGRGKARVDYLQRVRITSPQGEFHVVIPWSGPHMLPHEFFSWINGDLPAPLALKRGALGSWSNGRWVGPDGEVDHPLARAAREHPIDMYSNIEWNHEIGGNRIELQWGLLAVPIRKEWYIHIVQTALQPGLVRSTFGLDWYFPRWIAFSVNELQMDGEHAKHFLFQPLSLFVFARELGLDAEDLLPPEAPVKRPLKIEDVVWPMRLG